MPGASEAGHGPVEAVAVVVSVRDSGVDDGSGACSHDSSWPGSCVKMHHMQATKWVQREINTMNLSRCSSTVLGDGVQGFISKTVCVRGTNKEGW